MEALSYYRVGRTTLPRGVLLRVAVGLGSDWGLLLRNRQGPPPLPSLLLVPSETAPEGEHAAEPFGFEPSRSSEDGRFLFEVPTEALDARPFELLVQVGDEERAQLGEEIWILEREDYEGLLREWEDEEFLPSPSLHGGPAVAAYVEDLIRERLLEDNFAADNPRLRFRRSMPEGIAGDPFPSSAVRWTTEKVLDAFREVALFGVKDVSWTLELTGDRYGLSCNGELLDPLSNATVEALLGEGGERFSSLAFKDLRELDVSCEIGRGFRSFSLGASLGIDGFPIEAGATTSRTLGSPRLDEAHLPGADRRGGNFEGANLREGGLRLRGADLQGANLQGANLQEVDLRGAILRRANLRRANLEGANLWGADLRGADLEGSDFQRACLLRAYLQEANLQGANLLGSNLREAYLQEADLQRANLRGANLRGAYLSGADLLGADVREADLRGVNLRSAELEGAMHLTQEQLEQAAIGDERTTIPSDLAIPATWFVSADERAYTR